MDGNGIGANIRALRAYRGITQQKLAEDTGLTRQTIWAIEHGRTDTTMKAIQSIADALGVSFQEIVSEGLLSVSADTAPTHTQHGVDK